MRLNGQEVVDRLRTEFDAHMAAHNKPPEFFCLDADERKAYLNWVMDIQRDDPAPYILEPLQFKGVEIRDKMTGQSVRIGGWMGST